MKLVLVSAAAALAGLPACLAAAGPPEPAPAQKAFERWLGTTWYGLYLVDRKIGWMKAEITKSPDGRTYEIATTSEVLFSVGGVDQTVRIAERRTYAAPAWRLSRIEALHSVGAQPTTFTGTADEQAFTFTVTSGGTANRRTLPLPKETFLDLLREQILAATDAVAVGARVAYPQFDVLRAVECEHEATVQAREEAVLEGIRKTVVTVATLNKMTGERTTAKVTTDGTVLEAAMAGFVQRAEPEATAKRIDVAIDPLALAAIRMKRELPDVARLSELVVTISGLTEDQFVVRSDRQVFEKTSRPGEYQLTLRRSAWKAGDLRPGPYEGEAFAEFLAPTPFIQSGDPRIKALAEEIVGDETDPFKRVGKLVEWVYRNVDKGYVAAIPNALEVLQTRRGDCTEHTVLFVALCRAIGIPAQELGGVAYINGFNGFAYHAWARVYIGTWIEVDPTFNEAVANPSHIVFAVGPIEKQSAIPALIGQVKIELVTYKAD